MTSSDTYEPKRREPVVAYQWFTANGAVVARLLDLVVKAGWPCWIRGDKLHICMHGGHENSVCVPQVVPDEGWLILTPSSGKWEILTNREFTNLYDLPLAP